MADYTVMREPGGDIFCTRHPEGHSDCETLGTTSRKPKGSEVWDVEKGRWFTPAKSPLVSRTRRIKELETQVEELKRLGALKQEKLNELEARVAELEKRVLI